MSARIVWLAASLAALLIVAAYMVLPAQVVALRAADLLGTEPAVAAAARGHRVLVQQVLSGELLAAAPWLMLGAALALSLRVVLRHWQRSEGRRPRSRPIVDAAGIALELRSTAFDHVPAYDVLALAPMSATRMPRGASALERQAFAALAAASPPDAQRPGPALLQQAQRRYDAAVGQYGAGSLIAIGAATRDLGWLIARDRCAGRWHEAHPWPEHLTTLALARLPVYWQLNTSDRARISALVDYLATGQTPLDAESALLQALHVLRGQQPSPARVVVQAAANADDTGAQPAQPRNAAFATAMVCAWLLGGALAALATPSPAQDAPMRPPRSEAVPPQRIGDVVVEGSFVPVWTAPPLETGTQPRIGRQIGDPAIVARIPPPAPRRRAAGGSLDGVADRPEWRATVPAGRGVPLAAAVVRIAPPGLQPPAFGSIDAELLQAPVSWSAGLDRATALEGILRANGLRATVTDASVSVSPVTVTLAAVVDDPAAWRRRAAELEAAAQEARRAELATLAREREELEARRRVAEFELKQVQKAAEKLQHEHRSRLSAANIAFADREWRLSPEDSTLRQGLARWARLEGVGFAWEADYDLPVVSELAYRGSLPMVIERLMQKVPPASKLIYSLDRRHGLVVRAAPRS